MKAIVSVIGKDKKGIIAKVSNTLFQLSINIEDISQTVMQDYFTMIMLVDLSGTDCDFNAVSQKLQETAGDIGVEIHIQNEAIFNSMHRI